MLVPFAQHGFVVLDVACHRAAFDEALRLRRTPNAIAFMIQAQTRVGHVLRDEMRRLSHREIILCIAGLRSAISADLTSAPGLRGEPLAHVVAIAKLAPLKPAIAAIHALAQMRATVVDQRDDEATLGKFRRSLARSSA